jgi:hypothetical protein
MSTMVVYESLWGNTEKVAQAIAEGIGPGTTVVDVGEAPAAVPDDVGLLVVGGPTHAFSMSRPSTRESAADHGADAGHEDEGIREWLTEVKVPDGVDVATFDTRVTKTRRMPGSAAKAAARLVRHRHLGHLVDIESFFVEDSAGPLEPGEVLRARGWGRRLALKDRGQGDG